MSKSDYLENKIVQHAVGKAAFTMPAAAYLGLFKTVPNDQGGTEPSGGGYARVAVTWGSANAGVIANAFSVTIGPASAAWGTIYGAGLFDAGPVGTGNLLYHLTLQTPRTINSSDSFTVVTGALTVTEF